MIIVVKMDLALNNLQKLIWHTTQITNQDEKLFYQHLFRHLKVLMKVD